MVDFTKLLNETPEQKAERAAERQQMDLEFSANQVRLVALRSHLARALARVLGEPASPMQLKTFDSRFAFSMMATATQIDPITRSEGGKLAYLSSDQLDQFERIVHTYLEPADIAAAKAAGTAAREAFMQAATAAPAAGAGDAEGPEHTAPTDQPRVGG